MAKNYAHRTRCNRVAPLHVLPEALKRLCECIGTRRNYLTRDDQPHPAASTGERWCGDNPDEVAKSLLLISVIEKFDDGKSASMKYDAAYSKFAEAEEMCRVTNERLRSKDYTDASRPLSEWSILSIAARKISDLLGVYDETRVHAGCSFTGGASTRLPRRKGHPAYKFSGQPETTFDNLPKALELINCSTLWSSLNRPHGTSVVRGNKVISVPKTWKTDRMIAIEPEMNMYVQKGLGSYFRDRLRSIGINLNSQETNRDLALFGSKTGLVATLDLSMASDTVSYELVKTLLPWDWFVALLSCRSSSGTITSPDGSLTTVEYEKFSSMGNGYTFELETLIFWAICSAVAEAHGASSRLISVYGDDIIVPTVIAQSVVDQLAFCGFRTNEKKSFIQGEYRESCGKHYFQGKDVSPFFVKRPTSDIMEVFKLHNKLWRWLQTKPYLANSDQFRGLLNWIREQAPPSWQRPRIPDGYGDGAFIGTFDTAHPKPVSASWLKGQFVGWCGWWTTVLTRSDIVEEYDLDHLPGLLTWRLSQGFSEPYVGLPTGKQRTRKSKLLVAHFP